MQDTVFTKIINRELPANIVFEDDESIAFLDIHPVTDGHLLLIPKEPYTWMYEVPDELLGKMFIKAKRIMKALIAGLGCDLVQLTVVGKDVPHFHIQLIPRKLHETGAEHPKTYEPGQAEMLAETIRTAIEKTPS